jgi:hypothetical protein
MNIYLSESRITAEEEGILNTESIEPGSKTICHARVQLLLHQDGAIPKTARAKLDSCVGSVSIAHANLLNHIKPAKGYKLPNIRLRGIGGKTQHAKECREIKYYTNKR